MPDHIIQHHEVGGTEVKAVVRRTVNPLKRFVAERVILRIQIQVMIANHVVPGNANQGDRLIQWFHHREVIEDNVAEGHPKGSVVGMLGR